MNTSMNRLGFGGTATGHIHFQNNDMEDMLVHNTAKLQLSVRMKSHTHFVKTCLQGLNAI